MKTKSKISGHTLRGAACAAFLSFTIVAVTAAFGSSSSLPTSGVPAGAIEKQFAAAGATALWTGSAPVVRDGQVAASTGTVTGGTDGVMPEPPSYPPFFDGQVSLGNGWYWLQFPSTGNCFGYYNLDFYPWIYHQDMGWEYFSDANNGGGAYLYDSASGHLWYTSSTFPYLYDFSLQALLYYLPIDSCRYSSNPRWFYNFSSHQWINL